jgi:auxin-responsive protein IAA
MRVPPAACRRKRLVGWPPVKCAHRRSGGGGYVKVKMEGVAIGRKVHVSLHGSYDALLRTLDRMFPRPSYAAILHGAEEEDEVAAGRRDGQRRRGCRREFVVTYDDGEGDWLLVGDVPWE